MRTHTAVTLGLAALLIACDDASRPVAPDGSSLLSARATAAAATASQIARLRRFVAPFHQVEAGWSAPVTPCLEAPGLGAMGFHYGNPDFVGDGGAVNLLEPELLLYEPQKNGKLRFVGVEYIVLFSDHPANAAPPTLLGQPFKLVPDAGLWGRHICVGRHNPSGTFASWNPKVTCEPAGT